MNELIIASGCPATRGRRPEIGAGGAMRVLLAGLFVAGFSGTAMAQTGFVDKNFEAGATPSEAPDEYGFRNGSVVVAPIPFANPTIGNGLALGAGYLFQADPGSKPSNIGIGGFRSDNGSAGYGVSISLALNDNKWLIKALLASADVKYDLYTPLVTLPIRQDGILGRFSLSYGVTPELSFGGTLRYLDTSIGLEIPGFPPIPPEYLPDLGLELLNIGFITEWDRRDDALYPTSGTNLKLQAIRGMALSGLSLNYEKAFVTLDLYKKLGNSGVLATRFTTCAASTDTPFFDKCSLGGTDSFRGFSSTQFLDLRMASAQVEYRQQLSKRLGGVVFAGIGKVGPNYRNFAIGAVQSAGGVGVRYRVSKKFPLDFSVDASRNSLNENQLYIYVGQRF
jgi:Omp85 superfamily domain